MSVMLEFDIFDKKRRHSLNCYENSLPLVYNQRKRPAFSIEPFGNQA